MKPLRFSREGVLKGFLFLALLANVSWHPIAGHLGQLDLASGRDPADNTATGRAGCQGADAQNNPSCRSVPEEQRERAGQTNERIQQEIAQARGGGSSETTARPATGAAPQAAASQSTTSSSSTSSSATRTDTATRTEGATCVECEERAEAQQNAAVSEQASRVREIISRVPARPSRDEDEDEEESVDQTRVANCQIDRSGDDLEPIDEIQCLTSKMSRLRGNSSAVAEQRRDFSRRIKNLFDLQLRRQLRNQLFGGSERRSGRRSDRDDDSSSSSSFSEAQEAISSLISSLNRIRMERDSDRTRIIETLEGLRAAGEAREAAAEFDSQVDELRREIGQSYRAMNEIGREYQNSCAQGRCDRDLAEQLIEKREEFREAYSQRRELAEEIADEREDAMDNVNEHDGELNTTERRAARKGFDKHLRTLAQLRDPRAALSRGDRDEDPDSIAIRDDGGLLDPNNLPPGFQEARDGNFRRANNMFDVNQIRTGAPLSPAGVQQQQQVLLPQPQVMQPNQYGFNTMQFGRPMVPGAIPLGQQYGMPGQYGMPYGQPQAMNYPQPMPPPGGMPPGAPLLPPPGAPRPM